MEQRLAHRSRLPAALWLTLNSMAYNVPRSLPIRRMCRLNNGNAKSVSDRKTSRLQAPTYTSARTMKSAFLLPTASIVLADDGFESSHSRISPSPGVP